MCRHLTDGPANSGQLTHAVTTAGPMVAIGAGIGWVNWQSSDPPGLERDPVKDRTQLRQTASPTRYEGLPSRYP